MSTPDLYHEQVECHFDEVLVNWVKDAIRSFELQDSFLLENDASERCICARFAMHLEKVRNNIISNRYFVDVEYNIGCHGNDSGRKMMSGKKVILDLVIHKRVKNEDGVYSNIICIEMKKEKARRKNIESDLSRLQELVSEWYGFNYKAGFFIIIKTGSIAQLCVQKTYFNNLNKNDYNDEETSKLLSML